MTGWKKYRKVALTSWSTGFVYRANFIMWRVRMVLQCVGVFLLWQAITKDSDLSLGYDQSSLFAYVLGVAVLRSIVLSSRSIDAQTEIATGELSNYLVKPINYFGLWFSRDIADKLLNALFCLVEISIFYIIVRPPLFIQSDPKMWVVFMIAVAGASLVYFLLSFIISMTTFWYSEANGWPQRFLIVTLMEFLIGSLFPLDILSSGFNQLIKYLPTTYMVYFPMQIYLDRLTFHELVEGFVIVGSWLLLLTLVMMAMWRVGTKSYEAYGR